MKRQSRELAGGFGVRQATTAAREAEQYYQNWSRSIGVNDSIKTLAKYYNVKYNDSPRFELLRRYADDVAAGWISPLSHFDNYEALYNRIQTEIVGRVAGDGTIIKGQSRHFMQRILGTMADPKKLRDDLQIIRRSGVEIDNVIDAVLNPVQIYPARTDYNGNRSVKLRGHICAVTVNPDSGILIQTNPLKEAST